ncbi:WRKY transcription factor 22-like [Carex rostrata]
MDSVRSLHLRSSLRTNIVPLVSLCTASLSLEEMREDLHAIGWEEFTVQSVVTVETAAPAMSMPCCFSVPAAEMNEKRKEIEKESASIYHVPSVESSHPVHKSIRVPAKTAKNADKYSWQKYDSRKLVDHPYRQRYYKCHERGCHAKKVIDRDANDSSMLIITYDGEHNHSSP